MTGIGAAQSRLLRLMCFSLGSASILFLALNAPAIVIGASELSPWWTVAFLAVFGSVALLLAVGFWGLPIAALLGLCLAHAVVFALGLATLPLAANAPLATSPWLFNLAVLGAAGAGVAFGGLAGWGYVGAASVLMVVAAALTGDASPAGTPLQSALLNVFFMTLFFAIARATWRAGRLLDEAADSAIREARSAAAASARAAEDVRVQSLVHDSVLVALLAFARSPDPTEPRVREQARRSLSAIDSLEVDAARHPLDARQLIRALQSLATEIAPDSIFVPRLIGEAVIPHVAVDALSEALGEALRNSVVHASSPGVDVDRRVVAAVSDGAVTVVVSDRGRGFDPDQISRDRLGIRAGIIGRMERLPGGAAVIDSRPGSGTIVRLAWNSA